MAPPEMSLPTNLAAERVAELLAQGYGESHRHPHVPFVGQSLVGPVLLWRKICAGRGCGEYLDDVAVEPPVDELCEECLMSVES